jgi:DNA polymerase III epsilon subunit-like protein
MMTAKPLDFVAGPLVWIDCEMTGLNPRKHKILEIAVRFLSYSAMGMTGHVARC